MAGADRAEDRALLNAWAAQALPGTQLQLVNDAALLLAAGTPNGWGLALISGTGSIAYGTAPDGVIARAGGWGYLFGDEGSGYAIGVAALRAVAQATDGRATATLLTQAVLTHWSLPHATALISHVYRGSVTRAEIAALARLVDSAATEGDAVADAILRNAAYALALAAATVCERIALPGPTPCALAGGVLLGSRNLRAHLESALQVYALGIAPLALVAEPALGALKLASRNVR
jgi:N-acetylglucosamine kinase-like BadF-type ATPase